MFMGFSFGVSALRQEKLPSKWLDHVPTGVPLCWGETKSVALWKQIINDTGVKLIGDSSPSTALAVACLELGIRYVGLTSSSLQTQWLVNTVDRAALKWVCTAGSFLYQEDLAAHIRELFSDVVDPHDDALADEAIALSDDEAA